MPAACSPRQALLVGVAALLGAACSHDWESLSGLSAGGGPGQGGAGNTGNVAPQGGAAGSGATGGAPTGGDGGDGASSSGGIGGGGGNGAGPVTGGSGGSITNPCANQDTSCDNCVEGCATTGPCQAQFEACLDQDDCVEILDCIDFGCDSLKQGACVNFCLDSGSQSSQDAFASLVLCTHCNACALQCMDDVDCGDWI